MTKNNKQGKRKKNKKRKICKHLYVRLSMTTGSNVLQCEKCKKTITVYPADPSMANHCVPLREDGTLDHFSL